jgi:MFS family permease
VVGFLAGTIVNRLGVRYSIGFGGIGYSIYAGALLASVHHDVPGFNIFAGAFLGVCAGVLWAAQGVIMVSYPTEAQKGRYWAWFWAIFNIGGCIGSLIPLGQNINVKVAATVTDGTYVAFIVLMVLGALLALFLVDADKIIRADGTKVILMKNPSWWSELKGLYTCILAEPYIILLFPMMWSSNWFYTYQENAINAAYFDTRTRALNDFLYWFAQICAASVIGPLLDNSKIRRTIRARIMYVTLIVLTVAIYGGGWAWQKSYDRADVSPDNTEFPAWDWDHPGFVGPMFLYFFYGAYDAVWQGCMYWFVPPFLYHMSQFNANSTQDHGCSVQLRSSYRQLRRFLQGPSIRRCRRHVVSRLSQAFFQERVGHKLGLASWISRHRCSSDFHPY